MLNFKSFHLRGARNDPIVDHGTFGLAAHLLDFALQENIGMSFQWYFSVRNAGRISYRIGHYHFRLWTFPRTAWNFGMCRKFL